jgi:hypothetical protein
MKLLQFLLLLILLVVVVEAQKVNQKVNLCKKHVPGTDFACPKGNNMVYPKEQDKKNTHIKKEDWKPVSFQMVPGQQVYRFTSLPQAWQAYQKII